jgi:MFS superfamily sulfate permease-like transporter
MEGLTIFPLIILAGTMLLLIFELHDWLKGKPKNQKMNLIQFFCLISFFVMLIFKIQHYPGAVIPMIFFHFSIIGVAIDLMISKRYLTSTNTT